MKKKQKGKLVLGLFIGCCLLYAMSGFSTKSVQAAASLQKEDGQLVGGKAQDISPAGKYKPKENEDAKNTEVKSQDTKSTEAENIEVKDQEEQKSTGTNDLTQNATGASAQSGTYGNVKWKLSGTTLTITGSGAMPDASLSEPAPWSELNVKSVVISEGITVIGQQNFCRMSSITSVSFPQSLQTIKEAAFYECSSLTGVKLAKNVKTIESGAFAGCTSLAAFSASGVTTMGDYALQETVITTFEIPKKMTKFSPQILFGNTSLSELKVASGNTAFIAEDGVLYTKDKSTLVLFPVDKAVTQFTVPTGVKQIGDYAFSKTRNLKSVRFSNVTTLGEGAFYDSSLSGALVLTDKITTAGSFAFDSCTEITSVKFGKGLKESPYRMFEACSSIKTIDFGGLQTLGMRTFCDCSSLVNVTLPDRMKKWGGSVFNSCSSLKTFTAKGLETIGYADFAQCYALETVNLSKVKTIYRQAFANCPSLTSITLPASTQYVDENAFEAGVQVNCLNKELVKFGKNGLHYAEKITISGTRDYKKAFEVLSIVNKKRAENGLSALTMDSSLLETAMIRAGEQEVLFSHTRPDGAGCFSANAAMIAENVAINQRSASEVMNSWMNSEGHRENILSKDATTIGIGCFYMDGVYTWAQCFGNAENPQAAAKPANQTVSQSMYIPNGTFSEAITSRGIIWNTPKEYTYQFSIGIDSAKCQVGKKTQAKLWLINPEFGQKAAFSSKNITWVSGNTKIAKTDAKGKVSFVGSGNVTITGKTKYYQTSVKIKVKVNGKTSTKKSSKVVLKDKYAIYTGKAIKIGKAKVTGSKGKVTYTYYTDAKCKKKLKNYPKKVGTYYVRAKVAATDTHKSAQSNIAKLVIQKKNPMTVKVKSKTYKAKASTGKLAKNYSFKIGVTKAKGTVTYSKSKNCKKYITVNNKGKVTIKKGTPRGKYTINVKAKGKGTYASRTIKVSIKVE